MRDGDRLTAGVWPLVVADADAVAARTSGGGDQMRQGPTRQSTGAVSIQTARGGTAHPATDDGGSGADGGTAKTTGGGHVGFEAKLAAEVAAPTVTNGEPLDPQLADSESLYRLTDAAPDAANANAQLDAVKRNAIKAPAPLTRPTVQPWIATATSSNASDEW